MDTNLIKKQLEKIEELKTHPNMQLMKNVGVEFVFDGVEPDSGLIVYHLENASDNDSYVEQGKSTFSNYENPVTGEVSDVFKAVTDSYIRYWKQYCKDGNIQQVGKAVESDLKRQVKYHQEDVDKQFTTVNGLVRDVK